MQHEGFFPGPITRHLVRRWEAFDGTHVELVLPELDPAHDGLSIAHLSDLHVGPGKPDGRMRAAIQRVNEAQPDLVFLTGDFVTRIVGDPRRLTLLGGLMPPTFASLGNHDHWVDAPGVQQVLESLGYKVLSNTHVVMPIRGKPVTVIGIDDGFTHHDDVAAAFEGVPTTGTRLVLAHTPPTAEKLPPNAGLACFSGHTHGGQFVVPKLTELFMDRIGQRYMTGLHRVNGNLLYVNRGLGFGRGGPMIRMAAAPEVAFLTLRRESMRN